MIGFKKYSGEIVPCTIEEYRYAESDELVVRHEAQHAISGWVMGLPLRGMWIFNSTDRRRDGVSPAACGAVLRCDPIEDKFSLPLGERLVLAKQIAFMEILGVYGLSGEAYSSSPLLQDRTTVHQLGALRLYQRMGDGAIGSKTTPDTVEEIQRLIPVVENFFADERIRALTQGLANELLKKVISRSRNLRISRPRAG